jgi:hypothetical protein
MPRSKNIHTYPSHFLTIAQNGLNPAFEIRLELDSKQLAQKTRLAWYGFLVALDGWNPELGRSARGIMCKLAREFNPRGKIEVTFLHRDRDPSFAELARALSELPPPPPQASASPFARFCAENSGPGADAPASPSSDPFEAFYRK